MSKHRVDVPNRGIFYHVTILFFYFIVYFIFLFQSGSLFTLGSSSSTRNFKSFSPIIFNNFRISSTLFVSSFFTSSLPLSISIYPIAVAPKRRKIKSCFFWYLTIFICPCNEPAFAPGPFLLPLDGLTVTPPRT